MIVTEGARAESVGWQRYDSYADCPSYGDLLCYVIVDIIGKSIKDPIHILPVLLS